jgi:hypothetical protein
VRQCAITESEDGEPAVPGIVGTGGDAHGVCASIAAISDSPVAKSKSRGEQMRNLLTAWIADPNRPAQCSRCRTAS